ncbi:cytochrome b [Alkalimonas mucilaginosa]|uniref:Cytochrome b n=1 Tax=Alkalimonas mucilaginosa TaxID=3057676 RepID=A0ABU7JGJ8_9GAMM|nr:cytochrome b [Alkalimonas sp. MEB004]MEE2024812.1 cytochrome b [Alkalimonas sp. MEB004]
MNKPQSYPLAMRVMHWLMAALVLCLLFAGLTMVKSLGPWQQQLLAWHKAMGLIALLAIVVRLIIRLRSEKPTLPASVPNMQQLAAKLTQLGFYLLLFVMPLSGYLMQNAAGRPLSLFGLPLPSLLHTDLALYGLFREIHGWAALLLVLLIVVHSCAALYHGLIKRDGVFRSMVRK